MGDRLKGEKFLNVAVLFGGASAERDVSIASGVQVVKGLEAAGHHVLAVDTARGLLSAAEQQRLLSTGVAPAPPQREALEVIRPDCAALVTSKNLREVDLVFLALHGGSGEDGTIQAFLDLAGIAYTGSDHRGSGEEGGDDVLNALHGPSFRKSL